MKDMASIIGQLGGLYTALFLLLKPVNDAINKAAFGKFTM